MSEQKNNEENLFGVWASKQNLSEDLIQINLTFSRLLDDIVVPYESDNAFFIDGVPINRKELVRIKIFKQKPFLVTSLNNLHNQLRVGDTEKRKLLLSQYHTMLEALIRESSEDVTSQIIKAFDTAVKPRLKDYLPKREEMISAALKVFIEGMKQLG